LVGEQEEITRPLVILNLRVWMWYPWVVGSTCGYSLDSPHSVARW
jgi:hypothetical protein